MDQPQLHAVNGFCNRSGIVNLAPHKSVFGLNTPYEVSKKFIYTKTRD